MVDLSDPNWDCPRNPEEDARRQREWEEYQRTLALANWNAYLRRESEIQNSYATDVVGVYPPSDAGNVTLKKLQDWFAKTIHAVLRRIERY